MKKENEKLLIFVVFSLIFGIFLIGVVCAGDCSANPDDIIMKLFSSDNSHGALWNDTAYTYDICCEDIFGVGALECSGVHTCTGTNNVLLLSDISNAHASAGYIVNITLDSLIHDFGEGHEDECKFPYEFRSNTNIPLHIEIRDMDDNLVGGVRDITTDKLWQIGDVITSGPVNLIPGQSYKFFLDIDQARYYDAPFYSANNIRLFEDMHGQGGVDIGCGRNLKVILCSFDISSSYNHYYCGGGGATVPSYGVPISSACGGGTVQSNTFYTYSCGDNGETNYDGPYNVKVSSISKSETSDPFSSQVLPNLRSYPYPGNRNYNLIDDDMGNFEFTFIAGQTQQTTDHMSGIAPYAADATVTVASLGIPVCYGDLECVSDLDSAECSTWGGEVVVSLYDTTNSHISEGDFAGYDTKICCRYGGVIPTGDIYWADMDGNPITDAEIGDSVLMIYQNMAGQNYDFEIFENDAVFDDPIRSVVGFDFGADLAAKWIITIYPHQHG